MATPSYEWGWEMQSFSHEAAYLAKNWDAAAKEEKGGYSETVSGVCRNWLFSRSGSLVGGTVNWASFLLQSLPWTGSPVLLKWALGKWETQAATRRELRVRQKLRVLLGLLDLWGRISFLSASHSQPRTYWEWLTPGMSLVEGMVNPFESVWCVCVPENIFNPQKGRDGVG